MGVVTRPHGVRGELKVRPETDDPARFVGLKRIYLGSDEQTAQTYEVRGVRLQSGKSGTTVLLRLVGVEDRTAAEALARALVFALEADLPPLDEGEVYLSELVGLVAHGSEGELLGSVEDVLDLPGQTVLRIRLTNGAEALVPFVDAFVASVDLDAGVVRLTPIEGLLDPAEEAEVA